MDKMLFKFLLLKLSRNVAPFFFVLCTSTGHANRRDIDASSIFLCTGNGAGGPSECNTFDDLGDKILRAVLASGKDFHRIDVTFDRYKETSIEYATKEAFSRSRKTLGFVKLNCQASLASTIAAILFLV